MPKPNDPCGNCNHAFEFHATDMSTEKLRCWHGSVIGDTCPKQCLNFVPMEVK